MKKWSSALSAVVCECTKMESDIRSLGRCSDIFAAIVVIDFLPNNSIDSPKIPFFCGSSDLRIDIS